MNEKFVVKGARPDLLPDRFVRNVMEVALQFMPGRRFFRMDILRFITLTRVARLEFRQSGKSAVTLDMPYARSYIKAALSRCF
jgi:hypothetical protein